MGKNFGDSGTLLDSSVPSHLKLFSPPPPPRPLVVVVVDLSMRIRIMSTDVKCLARAYRNGRLIDKKPR